MTEPASHTKIGWLFVGGCVLIGLLLFAASHMRLSSVAGNTTDMNVTDTTFDNGMATVDPLPEPVDLSSYIGQYPSDGSGGARFLDDLTVRAALIRALGSEKKLALFDKFAVETPIVADGDGLRVHGCEARNCGNGYTLLIARDGSTAQVCFQDFGGTGDGKAYWYANGGLSSRSDNCPDSVPTTDTPSPGPTPDDADTGATPKDSIEN